MTDNLFERLQDLSIGTGSRTPMAAIKRITELELALKKLEYWFDTDQEILDAMTDGERADHMRQLNIIRDALSGGSES